MNYNYLTRDYYGGFINDRENMVQEKYGEIALNQPLYPGHDNPSRFPGKVLSNLQL